MTSPHSSPFLPEFESKAGGRDETFTIGVDLGQSHDPTAIAVVRALREGAAEPIFQVGHLERLPLGTPYPGVVSHVARIMARPPLRGVAELVLDFTGVGRPVFDTFRAKGLSPIGVTITAGDATSHEGFVWRVPKLILISQVQALLHCGRLKIHKGLPDAQALVEELQDFKAEVTDSGYWRFGARAGKHDDLVLSLAIALWRAVGDNSHTGMIEYYRRLSCGHLHDGIEETAPVVRMRAPAGVTTVYASDGSLYNVGPDGCVIVADLDIGALRNAGFVEVEES